MRGIAIILLACLLFMSSENLRANLHSPGDAAPMECCSDCCSDSNDPEQDQKDAKEPCQGDQDCLPGCNCSCKYQTTAITYNFMELAGTVVQSYHYGHYSNTYSYEYTEDFLQPPRFG